MPPICQAAEIGSYEAISPILIDMDKLTYYHYLLHSGYLAGD